MLKTNTGLKTAVCLTASVLLGASAFAAEIYDNSEAYLGQVTGQGNAEIGDVVIFGGTDRILQEFQFEYFLGANANGNEMAQVFLRALDGPVLSDGTALPSTILYSTPAFSLTRNASGFGRVNISGLNVAVPDRVAWTVAFTGFDGLGTPSTQDDETGGLLFYLDSANPGTNPRFFDPATGAQEHYTIRRDANGSWDLLNHPGVVDNLGARFTAVPEPTTWALLLGGLATLGLIRRRKS
jgi:hypothetical protein